MFSIPGYNKTLIQTGDIALYPEFNQRHIMALTKVPAWTQQETKLQLNYNRMLQAEYIECNAEDLIEAAKLSHQNWLTDFAPLTLNAALYFNICAELITFYQLELNDCMVIADEIHFLCMRDPDLKIIEKKIETKLSATDDEIGFLTNHRLETEYKNLSKQSEEYNKIKAALYFIEKSIKKNALTHEYLEKYLSPKVYELATKLCISKKPIEAENHNNDVCILGAPGSGKSSIIKEFIQTKRNEYVTICTDDYRGFCLPSTKHFEKNEQRFISTQDSAYIIKTLIALRLRPDKVKHGRPNIYIDGVSLEDWQQTLIQNNASLTSCIAGLSNINQVPKRAYLRAETSMHPADSKRHINTTSLLSYHKVANQRLLTTIPAETKTMVYDSSVPRNQKSVMMGIINNKNENPNITVTHLARFCDYMGKSHVNTEADFGGMLFFDGSLRKYRFTYDALYKAEQLLKLIEPNPHCKIKNFDLFITQESKNENPVCKISYVAPGSFKLSIIKKELFTEMLKNPDKKQRQQLQALILIICYGNKVRHQVEVLGKNGAFLNAMMLLKLDEHLNHGPHHKM